MKTSKLVRPVERLFKMFEGRKINFDLVIQRKNNIWDVRRKSMFVHSILVGYPVPALFATKEDTMYHFLDGKQRLTSLFSYINNEFPLHSSLPAINGTEISGLRFSELPDELQQVINQYEIDIVKIEEVTQVEMEELFYRLNNGVPLKQIETTRAILGSKVLRFVENIASMDFFNEKVNLSKSARQRYVDQELVLQILALIQNNETGFSGKEMQVFVQTLRDVELRDELKSKIQNAAFYLNEAFTKKEKFLKKLHVPMLFKLALDIQESGNLIPPSAFRRWAEHFFANTPSDYSEACSSGSARKENVQKRITVMSKHFYTYMEVHGEEERAFSASMEESVGELQLVDPFDDDKQHQVG